ncbi:hypothetical protein [Variovorax sp. N23]|uniref:hypothetical protein n=1 Tax=Variovorax sp. N23 TaxID=2980555 RepID=UPI0021C7B33D|nr:hypothetical protein [Variovorax sp. N23]MCU4119335.1 hypothetical protein [Variovorax sp. N23]
MSIENLIDAVEFTPIQNAQASDDGLPHATHQGVLQLVPGLDLKVYRLSDGKAVIDAAGMARFLQWLEEGV